MLICPNCAFELAPGSQSCDQCDWKVTYRQNVGVYLGEDDQKDQVFAQYFENYDAISEDDLEESILDQQYTEGQTGLMAKYVGPLGGQKVIDIGCGQGALSRKLIENGATSVTAVDISLAYLSRLVGNEQITPVLANAENLPFKNEFDIAVSTDVMEHVLNLGSFMFCLNRALKKGGRAFIRVPYRENLLSYSPHLGCKYRFVHMRTFNKELLKDVMEGAGFKISNFKLDGFFWGRPQKFWTRYQMRMDIYENFRRKSSCSTKHSKDIAYFPSFIANLLMKPSEIVVIAEKVCDIEVPT